MKYRTVTITQQTPRKMNSRRPTTRHIINKLLKIKHKQNILKIGKEKQHIAYKGLLIRHWQNSHQKL